MRKFLLAPFLLFALTSCFWNAKTPSTETGSTVDTTNSWAVVSENVSPSTQSWATQTTTGDTKKAEVPLSGDVKAVKTPTQPDLNAAAEQEKIVNDFEKEIDGLLKLIETDGTKK